jgi:hypothetical protein
MRLGFNIFKVCHFLSVDFCIFFLFFVLKMFSSKFCAYILLPFVKHCDCFLLLDTKFK